MLNDYHIMSIRQAKEIKANKDAETSILTTLSQENLINSLTPNLRSPFTVVVNDLNNVETDRSVLLKAYLSVLTNHGQLPIDQLEGIAAKELNADQKKTILYFCYMFLSNVSSCHTNAIHNTNVMNVLMKTAPMEVIKKVERTLLSDRTFQHPKKKGENVSATTVVPHHDDQSSEQSLAEVEVIHPEPQPGGVLHPPSLPVLQNLQEFLQFPQFHQHQQALTPQQQVVYVQTDTAPASQVYSVPPPTVYTVNNPTSVPAPAPETSQASITAQHHMGNSNPGFSFQQGHQPMRGPEQQSALPIRRETQQSMREPDHYSVRRDVQQQMGEDNYQPRGGDNQQFTHHKGHSHRNYHGSSSYRNRGPPYKKHGGRSHN